ncbi:unnamed protein product, partial [Ectocarpus fasciculatus]
MAEVDPRIAELQQLQREYRHMELNRRSYAEESQSVLRKQQQTIDKIRRDSEVLKSDIAMMMRGSTKPISASQHEHIQKLQDQGDKYANSIEFERRNITTMEEQIHIMKQKLLHQRKSMGGVNAAKENHHMIQKQIRILENRLDKALMKFNEAISGNKTLRDQIDDLRRERVVFENIYRKMERELQDRKRQMAEIIEVSNQMYEQRDQFQMEVTAIEQSNRKEQEEFENQMVELGRMLDTELRLPSPSRQTQRSPDRTMEGTEEMGSPDRRSLRSSGGFNQTGGTTAEKVEVVNSYERVQNFEEAFNKIKAATGITDIDELVRTFIKNEDHNFSLFNYVNEQNNEVEKLEEQIQVLREEEKKFAQESGEDVHQHKQVLKELEVKLQSTESMAEKYETRCQDLQRVIETLKRGVQSIFEKLGAEEMGVSDPSVTESNMVHYLGQVEQKANVMITTYAAVKAALNKGTVSAGSGPAGSGAAAVAAAKAGGLTGANTGGLNDRDAALLTAPAGQLGASKSTNAISVLGVGPKIPMGQELLHVNPPKLDDYQSDEDDDDDDEDARPLTRDELKARTMNRLQK